MSKCMQCKKRLGILEYKCKCGKIFCITHLHYMEHNCSYDYKKDSDKILKEQMEIGPLGTKLERI